MNVSADAVSSMEMPKGNATHNLLTGGKEKAPPWGGSLPPKSLLTLSCSRLFRPLSKLGRLDLTPTEFLFVSKAATP